MQKHRQFNIKSSFCISLKLGYVIHYSVQKYILKGFALFKIQVAPVRVQSKTSDTFKQTVLVRRQCASLFSSRA